MNYQAILDRARNFAHRVFPRSVLDRAEATADIIRSEIPSGAWPSDDTRLYVSALAWVWLTLDVGHHPDGRPVTRQHIEDEVDRGLSYLVRDGAGIMSGPVARRLRLIDRHPWIQIVYLVDLLVRLRGTDRHHVLAEVETVGMLVVEAVWVLDVARWWLSDVDRAMSTLQERAPRTNDR